MIVWGQELAHLEFAERLLKVKFIPAESSWLASVDANGSLLGVVVYTRFSKYNCEMSVAAASPRFLSKKSLKSFFGYPFLQLGLRRVTAVTEETNHHAQAFLLRLGFTPEGILRDWFETTDGIILGMLKGECKWL